MTGRAEDNAFNPQARVHAECADAAADAKRGVVSEQGGMVVCWRDYCKAVAANADPAAP